MATIEREWVSDSVERKVLHNFEWRRLNLRTRYDRALAGVLLAFARETGPCRGDSLCRVVGVGQKKCGKNIAIEIEHHKTRCLVTMFENFGKKRK